MRAGAAGVTDSLSWSSPDVKPQHRKIRLVFHNMISSCAEAIPGDRSGGNSRCTMRDSCGDFSSPAVRRAIHVDHGPPAASGSCRFTVRPVSQMPRDNNAADEREPLRCTVCASPPRVLTVSSHKLRSVLRLSAADERRGDFR